MTNVNRIFLIGLALALSVHAQEALTVDSVLKLAAAGLSEEVIAGIIKVQPGKYALDPDRIIAMKTAGVSSQLIVAMIEKNTAGSQQNTPPGAAPDFLVLHDATPIRLRLTHDLSSADATIGQSVEFTVIEDVVAGGRIVIPQGASSTGTVSDAEKKRRMGRGGRLELSADEIRLSDGSKVPLRGVRESKGSGHLGIMAGAMVVSAVVFWPAVPAFLLIPGKDTTIRKGSEIMAYVDGDLKFDRRRLAVQPEN